jgi:hypothetical protein
LSGKNGSIRKTKFDTVCRFCGKLLHRGRMARKFTVHGRTVYECTDHFPRESEQRIVTEMEQIITAGRAT